MIEFECENLGKKFINKLIFKGITFKLKDGDSLAVTGRNGAGKSTLIKIIANIIKATSGKTTLKVNGKEITNENYHSFIGLTAPYLNLYDELTAFENLEFFMKLKCSDNFQEDKIDYLLNKVNLYPRKNDLIREYSTGMKQKLKLAFAILNDPLFLLLDEPQSNLDSEGTEIINIIAAEQKERGILIIATNEIWNSSLCNTILNIEDYK